MIDFNSKLEELKVTKQQDDVNRQLEKDQEEQEKMLKQQQYQDACVIFDRVVNDNLDNIKEFLDSYGTFSVELTTGNLNLAYTTESNGITSSRVASLSVKYGDSIDVESNTIERLTRFVPWALLYRFGLVEY